MTAPLTAEQLVETVLDANGAESFAFKGADGVITRKFRRRDILTAIDDLQADGLITSDAAEAMQ